MAKAKVGNLAAGSGAKIRLTYVTELKVERGKIVFYIPTTIAPRYIPASDDSSAAKNLTKINYTKYCVNCFLFVKQFYLFVFLNIIYLKTSELHYPVDINASVQMASAIKEIHSPTHKISVNRDAVASKANVYAQSMHNILAFFISSSHTIC